MSSNRTGPALHSWDYFSPKEAKAHRRAYVTLIERVPRIAPLVAKIIIERLLFYHPNGDTSGETMEALVMKHVLHIWTSYATPLEGRLNTPVQALKAVNSRMRGVLRRWLRKLSQRCESWSSGKSTIFG